MALGHCDMVDSYGWSLNIFQSINQSSMPNGVNALSYFFGPTAHKYCRINEFGDWIKESREKCLVGCGALRNS